MHPTLWQLFAGFLEIALSGFGGVLAWAHRSLVERRAWLTEREFAEILGISQILPGGNIINVAIFVGLRFHGLPGVLAALGGLMLAPLALVLVLYVLLSGPDVAAISQPALHGAAPVVAGMLLATGLKMARAQRPTPRIVVVAGATLAGVGLAQLPLLLVLAVMAPLSLALGWRSSR